MDDAAPDTDDAAPDTDDAAPDSDDPAHGTDDAAPDADQLAPVTCRPVGTVRTPFRTRAAAPRQGAAGDAEGTVCLDPAFETGLAGLEPGDAVDVVWDADRADRDVLRVRDGRGVFATRSPDRPTPVCVTACDVLAVEGPRVRVRGVDMLDGSPVLDLKATMAPDARTASESGESDRDGR